MKTLGNIIWIVFGGPAHSLGVFHRRTDTDDNLHRHPIRKDALPASKAGSFTFWERIKLTPQCLTGFNKLSV